MNPRVVMLALAASAVAGHAVSYAAADGLAGRPASGPRVVILDEPKLPRYDVPLDLAPAAVAQRLRDFGMTVDRRGVNRIITTGLRDADILVLLNGNAYPRPLEPVLRAFKKRGGSIVANGVPLCHPCARTPDGWKDLGHDAALMKALGFGGFAGPIQTCAGLATTPAAHRCGLDGFDFASVGEADAQVLDPATLDEHTRCEPILLITRSSGPPRPVSALLIRTRGAPDAWAMTQALNRIGGPLAGRQLAEIVARVVALVADARGQIDLTARSLPPIPPELRHFQTTGLRLVTATLSPAIGEIYPHADGVAETLYVFDVRRLPPDERLLAATIQGLANRKRAMLWLFQRDDDPFWLAWLQKRGDVRRTVVIPTMRDLLDRFGSPGVVVYDPHLRHTRHIALMQAALDGCAVASPETARRFGLTIEADLRGRFPRAAAAYTWAFEHLWPRQTHRVIACAYPSAEMTYLDDYLLARRVFVFWISGWKDAREPGADALAERDALATILQQMPANIPILGYPYAGEGIGIQENPGVTLFSRCGKFLVATDHQTNLSVLTACRPVESLHQPPPRDIPLRRDRVYVTLTMSDGDNLNTYYDYFIHDWREPGAERPPIGWTLGPSACDLYPAVVDWYYRRLTPRDHFQCAVSGIGYVYPDHYAAAYANRAAVVEQFLRLTDTYMRRLDERTAWLMGISDAELERFARGLSAARALLPGYGRRSTTTLDNADTLLAGKPVLRVLVAGKPGKLLPALRAAVADHRPAFVHAFLLNWDWRLADVRRLEAALPDDYVLVRPDELARLYVHWRHRPQRP